MRQVLTHLRLLALTMTELSFKRGCGALQAPLKKRFNKPYLKGEGDLVRAQKNGSLKGSIGFRVYVLEGTGDLVSRL